jgi:hypothetical protein
MNGNSSVVFVENGNEFKTGTKRLQILAESGHADVFRVFELRDRTLGHIEPTG